MMRPFMILCGVVTVVAVVRPADFPPPDQLPRRPELPDPLVMLDGTRVTTRADWEARRRPELKALFEHYMYGRFPAKPERVTAKVLFEEPRAFAGKATLREVEIRFGPPEWPKIYLLVVTPNGRTPAPCFVGPNFHGNHCLVADERVRITPEWCYPNYPGVKNNRATPEGRGKVTNVWDFEQAVARGYAVATFYNGDIQPDRPHVREGMRATLPSHPGDPPGDETATIAFWAWGVQRCVDYLRTDALIDPRRIAAVGHSRLGKTVLLAAAFDDRIALVVPNQSGCGGTGPSRHANPKAETVKRITTAFPHWFCRHFSAFGDDPTRLPFDQNGLVALCAPRPVLLTNAVEDEWANPAGQFEVLRAAAPAYELYDVDKPVVADRMPPVGTLSAERLGYFIRPGKHAMTPEDWKVYLDYADKWLK